MATFDKAVWVWQQAKRVLAIGIFAIGVSLLWAVYTGDLQGPVTMVFGAVLTGVGFVGILFPSKILRRGSGGHAD